MNNLNLDNLINDLHNYFARIQFDWQTVGALIVAAVVLYIAFRIGTIILKIIIGLAFVALVIFAISKFLPYIGF